MKRLGTLALAFILVTGCTAMKPNTEEIELLSKEIEKRIYAQAWPTESATIKESNPTPAPIIVMEQEDKAQPEPLEPAEEPLPTASVSADRSEEIPIQSEESAETIEWPYITCPPEPTHTPAQEWPYIKAPEPPTYTPEPEPIEPPQEELMPTPQPTSAVPADPIDPIPEPTEQPAEPMPEPMPEPTPAPAGGYAVCSCGATLTPDELVPHMKAHAMNGENHSYRAY